MSVISDEGPATMEVQWPPGHHSAWVDVDLDAFEFNYRYILDRVSPAKIIAVVKAYGLGTGGLVAARKLESLGVYMLAVSNFHEGAYLRKHGIKSSILVMNGLTPVQMEAAVRLDLSFFVFDAWSLQTADGAGRTAGRPARVHLKVETGLGRLGLLLDEAPAIRDLIESLSCLEIEGIASQIATPMKFEQDYFTDGQYDKFLRASEILDPRHELVRHFSSSNTVPRMPHLNCDAVRCQSLLWGLTHYWPLSWPLKPVASFKARVVQVKTLPSGHNVGYNLRYTTHRPTRLAVLPIGVVDGVKPDHMSGGYVLIRGSRCPIIGVCSCEMMVDVTDADGVVPGDEVVLFGSQGAETLTAVEFGWAGNSSFFSVMALISPRLPRRYWEKGACVRTEIFYDEEAWEF